MPGSTILEISQPEQEWRLAELRRARHGDFLALQVLLLCTAGRTPTEIASGLFCSRASVYRIVRAYREHGFAKERNTAPAMGRWLSPSLRRNLVALRKKMLSVYGWEQRGSGKLRVLVPGYQPTKASRRKQLGRLREQ